MSKYQILNLYYIYVVLIFLQYNIPLGALILIYEILKIILNGTCQIDNGIFVHLLMDMQAICLLIQ